MRRIATIIASCVLILCFMSLECEGKAANEAETLGPPFNVEHCLSNDGSYKKRLIMSHKPQKGHNIAKTAKDWPPESVIHSLSQQHDYHNAQQFKGFENELEKSMDGKPNSNENDPMYLHMSRSGAGKSAAAGISVVMDVSDASPSQPSRKGRSAGLQIWKKKEIEDFANLVESNGMYRLRIRLPNGEYIVSSIPACELLLSENSSEIRDEIELRAGITGNLIGINYRVFGERPRPDLLCSDSVDPLSPISFLVAEKLKKIRNLKSVSVVRPTNTNYFYYHY